MEGSGWGQMGISHVDKLAGEALGDVLNRGITMK